MVRAISVILAVAVLLGVGWFFGHRPVADLGKRLDQMASDFQDQRADLEVRVHMAEARQALWAAHAELLLAAQDVAQHNFGTAGERLDRAHDRITTALATPGFTLDLARVSAQVETARTRVGSLDPSAAEVLTQAAGELYLLLDKAGQA